MKICALVICLVVAGAVVRGEEENEEPSMFEKFMMAVQSCKDDAGEGLNMAECFKTYVEGGDTNTPAFNQCKCTGACVSEKLGTLNDDATWNWEEMKNLNEQVKAFDEEMYNEGIMLGEKCKDQVEGATDKCDSAFKLFECSMKNSDKVKDKMEMIANSMS